MHQIQERWGESDSPKKYPLQSQTNFFEYSNRMEQKEEWERSKGQQIDL